MMTGRGRGKGENSELVGVTEEEREAYVVGDALLMDLERGGVQLEDGEGRGGEGKEVEEIARGRKRGKWRCIFCTALYVEPFPGRKFIYASVALL